MIKTLKTLKDVQATVEQAYNYQVWLLIVLKTGGWRNSPMWTDNVRESILDINNIALVIKERRLKLPDGAHTTISVDFRIRDTKTGWWSTLYELVHPTAEDIRRQLASATITQNAGYQISRQIAEDYSS